jgi:hypothetical protein
MEFRLIKNIIILLFLLLFISSFNVTGNKNQLTEFLSNNDSLTKYMNYIKGENLKKTVMFLSSPELKGRVGGSPGYHKASRYFSDEFQKSGLKKPFDSTYYQYFNTEYNEILSPYKFKINFRGESKDYKLGDDFVFRSYTGAGKVKSEIVFCGYGFSNDNYDDYRGIDVNGKVVMIFKQNPGWKIEGSEWSNSLRYREDIAYRHGAKAVILVSKPNDKNPQKPIGSVMDGEGEYHPDLPVLHANLDVANTILFGTNITISDLQTRIDSTKSPYPLITGCETEIEVNTKYIKEQPTMNVVGILEGTDEKLKNEYLVIGGHLDHVGSQADEIYFPGANDNASGSSAVLELARAFVNNNIQMKRSIIFVAFSNEESGLDGAKYFVEHPVVPLEKIVAMFNMDCIGYGDSLQIGNGKSSPVLWNEAKRLDSLYIKYTVNITWNGGGADAAPFHQKGIPCLYFVTTKSYDYLHLPSDTYETLNYGLHEKAVKLVFINAYNIVQGNYERENVLN